MLLKFISSSKIDLESSLNLIFEDPEDIVEEEDFEKEKHEESERCMIK